MNIILRGRTKEIIETLVREGYANSQSEAVRLAIIDFSQHHLTEDELVKRKLDKIDKDVRTGKHKLLDSKEALGKYAKYLK